MAPNTKLLPCDDKSYSVFAPRTQFNTIAGTVWRFILSENQTLVVTPYQTQRTPAQEVHGIPDHIESVFGGLSYFKNAIRQALGALVSESEMEPKLRAATSSRLTRWQVRLRTQVKAKKTKQAADRAAAELGRALQSYGVKYPGKEKLAELSTFVRECVGGGDQPVHHVRDVHFREVLAKVRQLTGVNIEERVFLDHAPEMPGLVESLAAQSAALEGISIEDARRKILRGARFVATFENAELFLVKGYSIQRHDKEDQELYERFAPSAQRSPSPQKTVTVSAKAPKAHSLGVDLTSSKKEPLGAGEQPRPTGPLRERPKEASCYRNAEGHERPLNDANLVSARKLADILGERSRSRKHRDRMESWGSSATYYLNGLKGRGRRPMYLVTEAHWKEYFERETREKSKR